jgi:hypothetical protein
MNFNLNATAYEKLEKSELELLKMMLKEKPSERITAADALKHSFFADCQPDDF